MVMAIFLQKVKDFLKSQGLTEEDYKIELSKWYDYEVEGWGYTQIKITLVKQGVDKFSILESLTNLASKTLPKEVLQETAIIVE